MSEPTAEQFLDILVRALANPNYWLSVGFLNDDIINLSLSHATNISDVIKDFTGSPASCIAQLAAYEAEKRLTAPNDPSTRIATADFVQNAVAGVFDDLPPGSHF